MDRTAGERTSLSRHQFQSLLQNAPCEIDCRCGCSCEPSSVDSLRIPSRAEATGARLLQGKTHFHLRTISSRIPLWKNSSWLLGESSASTILERNVHLRGNESGRTASQPIALPSLRYLYLFLYAIFCFMEHQRSEHMHPYVSIIAGENKDFFRDTIFLIP